MSGPALPRPVPSCGTVEGKRDFSPLKWFLSKPNPERMDFLSPRKKIFVFAPEALNVG